LNTEPWIFVVDKHGNVAAKFEALVAASEIDAALREVAGEGGS
jgi:glutathione peroxidase-family protein